MQSRWKIVLSALVVVLVATCRACPAQRYGFGMIKKTVVLQRRLLPDVQLGNVSVAVVFPRGTGGVDGNLFASDLETLVAQSGGGIRLVGRNPEFEIQCYTTGFQFPHITAKTENKVTTREAHGFVTMDARLIRVADGAVAVAFSESAYLNASNFGGPGAITIPQFHIPGLQRAAAPTPATEGLADADTDGTVGGRMVRTLALRVASHMVQMNESVPVLLAQGGPLDEADRYAVNNRWSEYLEKLAGVPPAPDGADNAYLLYDTGVADEALGYAASDPATTLKYLRESSINYSKAAEARPSEKYLAEPQKRIETAIIRYAALITRENAATARRASIHTETPSNQPPPETLTNADIVKLVQARLDHRLISNKIATTPAVNFDLSVDGLVGLSKSGVPSDIIAMMTNRAQARQAPGRQAR